MTDILISSQMFYPDSAATAKVITSIAKELSRHYSVKVVSQNRDYNNSNVVFPYTDRHDSIEIARYEVPMISKNSNLSRLLLMRNVQRNSTRLAEETDNRLYLAVSNPPNMAHAIAKLAQARKKPFVYLLHDLYPDVLEKLGMNGLISRLLLKRLRAMTEETFEIASRIVVLGRDVKAYLIENYAVPPEKIFLTTNFGPQEAQSIGADKREDYRKTKGWSGKFVVMYTGNLGETAHFDNLLNAAAELYKADKEIHFVIIGQGRKRQQLENLIAEKKLKNVELKSFVPEEEYKTLINSADTFFVSLRRDLLGISVPSKTYYYLSAGKPIIGDLPGGSEIDLAMKEDRFGLNCSDRAIAEVILDLKNDRELYSRFCEASRRAFEEKYRESLVTARYTQSIRELLR